MPDYEVLEIKNVSLQSGLTLRKTKLAYKIYGELNTTQDNVIIMPTAFAGQHTDMESMINVRRALNPEKYCVIVPNMFGSGLSSSPSNTPPPYDRAAFPQVTLYDNVVCQHRLVTEHLGIGRIKLVVGLSMGAMQAFQWGALYSDQV